MTPAVTVIVLNYNGERWLAPCLDALRAQRGAPSFEIVVVDNASSDRSLAVLGGYPEVRVVEAGANLGFAAGNNLGAKRSTADVLTFLNNDTAPEPGWLAELHRAFVAGGGTALVTSRIVFMDNGLVDSAGDGYFRAGGAYKRGHRAAPQAWADSGEVFGACGAAFMISRALFEALDGFDESFFMVYEDVDLSYRARLAGHRCWYAADAVVRHAGSATLGRSSANAVFYGQRNLEWVWMRNTPWPLLVTSAAAHVAYSVAGVLHYARQGRGIAALRAKMAAIAALPGILASRRRVQRNRVARAADIRRVLDRGWLRSKLQEKSVR
jgi:N-acetylglucosaminyl-diphospho-decaprenol L-rhamnosyltransferase